MARIPSDLDLERLNLSLAIADGPSDRLNQQIEAAFDLDGCTDILSNLDRSQALIHELCGLANWKRIMDGALAVLNARGGEAHELPLEFMRLLVARLRADRIHERRDEGDQPVRDDVVDALRDVLARRLDEPGMDEAGFPNYADLPINLPAGHWRHLRTLLGPPTPRS